MNKNVWLLFASNAFAFSVAPVTVFLSGIIGTNKACANETIEYLLKDIEILDDKKTKPGIVAIHKALKKRKVNYIDFIQWEVIDQAEIDAGKPKGKPREKFTYIDEMLALVN